LERNDHHCSFWHPEFFGYKDSECAKTQKIEDQDSIDSMFKKLFTSQYSVENFTIWRKLFLIALFSGIIAMIVFQRPWDDDWFLFVLTFIIFSVSYVFDMFYICHLVKDRHDLLKENIINLKKKIKVKL
jgi:hypothetical protein